MGVAPAKPSKGILTKKIGPLPTWGWMAVGLGVAVVIASINGNKQKSREEAAAKGNAGDYGGTYGSDYGYGASGPILIGGNQRPPVVFQNYTTMIDAPPVGGRPFPPSAPPSAPVPCPPSAGRWVQIPPRRGPKAASGNPLAALAREIFGSSDLWTSIWSAPENQALRARRKTPMMLRGGDRVWIPAIGADGRPCEPAPPPAAPACPPGAPPPCPPVKPRMPFYGPPPFRGGPGGGYPAPGRAGSRRYMY